MSRERVRKINGGGAYFAAPKTDVQFFSSGCKSLDLALGGGWAERRISNIIGDKCLSGDTIVSAQRGAKPGKMTMQTLFNRVKGNHWNRGEHDTYLVADIGGYAGMAKMVDIVMSGDKMLYEIVNDRGQQIRASEDHKFSTPTGWACISDYLSIGSSVKCWRGTRGQSEYVQKVRPYTYSIPFHPFGQRNVVAGRDYKRLLTARLVIEATINGITLHDFIVILRNDPDMAATLQYTSPDFEVQHLDGDPTNDKVDNLRLETPEDHWKIHAGEMPQDTKTIKLSEIISIRKVGKEPTFDITMEAPHHNFVADGFVVHNSTGKTLLCIEGAANFAAKYKAGKIRYREAEHAWSDDYARALGFPLERVDFGGATLHTVEDFFEDLEKVCARAKRGCPELYILDSLDSLTDRGELGRNIDEGSYGAAKAKIMSQIFRRLMNKIAAANLTLMIVSQIRSRFVTFGKQTTRSGGRALDFYASQVVTLAQIARITKTISNIKRPIGIEVIANVDKNKVASPYREAHFDILFGYGIDDGKACLDWLSKVGSLDLVGIPAKKIKDHARDILNTNDKKELARLRKATEQRWYEIEEMFLQKRKKYAN